MNWTMNYGHLIEVRFWSCVQKGVRTKTDIFDGTFCENSQGLKFFWHLENSAGTGEQSNRGGTLGNSTLLWGGIDALLLLVKLTIQTTEKISKFCIKAAYTFFFCFLCFSECLPSYFYLILASLVSYLQIVGDKAKGRIWKRASQENKVRQTFWKTNISYPLIHTGACAYQRVRNVHFSENLVCFVFL